MTAGETDSNRGAATPIGERAGDRSAIGVAEPSDRFGAGAANRRGERTGARGFRARWPLLLVMAWAALGVADIVP